MSLTWNVQSRKMLSAAVCIYPGKNIKCAQVYSFHAVVHLYILYNGYKENLN